MRKFMILGTVVALVVAALALPALAQDRYEDLWDSWEDRYGDSAGWDDFEDRYEDGFEEEGFFAFGDNFNEGRFFDEDGFFDEDDEDRFFDEDDEDDFAGNDSGSGVSQSFEQEAESGDVSQSFNVSNTGDNSNQCVGINGTANTGNAQNQVGVLQYASEADDFDFEDIESNIDVSGNATTTCDQQVNQAATAFGR